MFLFYLYANAKIKIHICSNKHETGLVDMFGACQLLKLSIKLATGIFVYQ